MEERDKEVSVLEGLIAHRLSLVGTLAESLEISNAALGRNDAEAIARGAAHQAELCSRWSSLEAELRRAAGEEGKLLAFKERSAIVRPQHLSGHNREPQAIEELHRDETTCKESGVDLAATARLAQLQAEWEKLSVKIRYLMRVHSSLLRHSQRSLAIIERVLHGCNPTYTAPRAAELLIEMHLGE